jgi:hypothetical protein
MRVELHAGQLARPAIGQRLEWRPGRLRPPEQPALANGAKEQDAPPGLIGAGSGFAVVEINF